ncbi:hypothetical protein FGO68_gene17206 [Halteria grandinella]|uniref:Uncharacterized protein n=1 Tax=Halteria grandinella TaxID=5974 RepID=A0A8J8T249_HALGN|nr:hypothetical protein FGO68_gene17206 [Halteria grandinella]
MRTQALPRWDHWERRRNEVAFRGNRRAVIWVRRRIANCCSFFQANQLGVNYNNFNYKLISFVYIYLRSESLLSTLVTNEYKQIHCLIKLTKIIRHDRNMSNFGLSCSTNYKAQTIKVVNYQGNQRYFNI